MNSDGPVFLREVARIDNPMAVAGQSRGHRARRLIDGQNPAFGDPFLLMAEDWMPRGAFALHPHRGIETVTFVIGAFRRGRMEASPCLEIGLGSTQISGYSCQQRIIHDASSSFRIGTDFRRGMRQRFRC